MLYFRHGTAAHDREQVAVWTRELVDAALTVGGSYCRPYRVHARHARFHAAYPRARELFALKGRLDPDYRFRNPLWERYVRAEDDAPPFDTREARGSEFLTVCGEVRMRDDFYRFLQAIYLLNPEDRSHALIIDACEHMVALAAGRVRDAGVETGVRVEALNLLALNAEEAYDAILSREVFLHMADEAALFAGLLRALVPGGRLLLTDYACGTGEWSAPFAAYVEARGYSLLTPLAYDCALRAAGFDQVEVKDRTDDFTAIHRRDLATIDRAPLALSERESLARSWRSKVGWSESGEPRWCEMLATRSPHD